MSVRISVESLSGCAWNGCPSQRGIRSAGFLNLVNSERFKEEFFPDYLKLSSGQ